MNPDIEPHPKPAPLTVIVVEKYPIARGALAALLTYDGYRVYQADSLQTAFSIIASVRKFSVLLADLDMPEWRSIVRCALKATDALVIGMEGNHPFSEMYDLKEHGIQVCLQKPLNYCELQAAIKNHQGLLCPLNPAGEKSPSDNCHAASSERLVILLLPSH